MLIWLWGIFSKGLCLSTCLAHEAVYFPIVGERLETGIKNALVLQSDEAVVLTAQEEFVDTLPDGKPRPLWSHDQLLSLFLIES